MKLNTPLVARRWRFVGPGTIVAVIIAIALVVSGRLAQQPPKDPNAGRIVFEADTSGKLRRVDRPSNQAQPGGQSRVAMPWKPEVVFLLDNAKHLQLTGQQEKELKALNDAWLKEKSALNEAIGQAAGAADDRIGKARAHASASASEIAGSFSEYSQLSKSLNQQRQQYWTRAIAKLTGEQVLRLNGLVDSSRKDIVL